MTLRSDTQLFTEPARWSAGLPRTIRIAEGVATVDDALGAPIAIAVEGEGAHIRLTLAASGETERSGDALAAVVESLTAGGRDGPAIALSCEDAALRRHLLAEGLAVEGEGGLRVAPELVWQRPAMWLPGGVRPVFPQTHVTTAGRRHPLRAPRPIGTVYTRFIPWLDRTLTFRVLEPSRDLGLFHRWMNDPRVDAVWEEAGDRETHAASLAARAADPHLTMLVGAFDGEPFGYFEVYWAREDRLGPHYDAGDHDRGWHVLIGEDVFCGRDFITAWMPSLMHYLFLDDPRTMAVVGEPRATHAQQIRNLDRAGFSKVKHIDFPHKRALLVMLLRERFFGDRLWAPEASHPSERVAVL